MARDGSFKVKAGPGYMISLCTKPNTRGQYIVQIDCKVYKRLSALNYRRLANKQRAYPTLKAAQQAAANLLRKASGTAAAAKAATADKQHETVKLPTPAAVRSGYAAQLAAAAARLKQEEQAAAEGAAAAAVEREQEAAAAYVASLVGPLTGSVLTMGHIYHKPPAEDALLPRYRIQLGRMLADGGFASVYVGCKLDVDDVPENTPEEAALAGADVAVKVYHTNVPNSTTEQLQAYANNEQMALSLLQNIDSPWGTTVVKLLATAELDPAVAVAASTPISSAASSGQQNQRSCHVDSSSDGSNATSNTNNQASYLQRCLVLEYLPRGAVSKISKKCPEESAKALLWPLLRTLMVMHSGELGCRIIHRDIKPDNLLLRQVESGPQRGFQLVLAEFGCCFIEPPGLNHPFIAGMHTCVGSTLYQAPEVAEGGCCLGSSIDTYSLGVTLMQLLGHLGSGCQNPKQGTTVQDVRQQLEEFVDGPADETASAAVREFVGCCCGVGRIRAVAAARGDAARMTAEQLFETTWMRYDRQQDEDDDVSELMGGGFTDDEQDYGDDDNNFSGAGGEAAGGGSAGAAGAPATSIAAATSDAAVTSDAPATHLLTGSILRVKHTFCHQASDIDSSCRVQLGRLLARGGFACAYTGRILLIGDSPAPTAAEAEAADADVVVKVYAASAPGCHAEQLQEYASTVLTALAVLRGQEAVVQLLATAVLDPADAASGGPCATAGVHSSRYVPNGSGSNWNASNSSNSSQGGYLQRCLVLEYLPKGAVSTVPFKCPEDLAKELLRPLLRTLKVLHSGELGVRIVHKDIKPENLLLRASKIGRKIELVLADFGCSCVEVKPRSRHPFIAGMHHARMACIGTSYYQAPELTSALGLAAAAAAGGLAANIDCYSFGVTVMQLLHCLEVHEGLSLQEVQQKVVEFVDAPGDDAASAAVREFVGCCCGVGRIRAVAATNGEAARMTAAQLLDTAWMRL